MGRRTQLMIGTMNGAAIVHVYSANPKTADGYNAFVFRRALKKSLKKLAWIPEVDGSDNPLPENITVGDASVRYSKEQKKALTRFAVERARSQYGTVSNDDFGEFEINSTFAAEVQRHAIGTRRELAAISSAREIAARMVHIAGSPNEEVAPKRRTKFFEYGLAKLRLSDGLYLVLGMVGVGVNLRLYYDQHVVAKLKANSEVTSLQGQPRIGEFAFDEMYDNRFRLIMQGVDLYFLQKGGHLAYNRKNASSVLASWLSGKNDIVLVTGRSSYEKCGAKSFFSPLLHGKRVTHLTTAGENARAEDVAEKRRQIPTKVDGYIAIGGGTVIDTTKLLRGLEGDLPPFLAVPTTAGTGAETTRFAVYYDHGNKMSADDIRYLPTDVVLVPEFSESQTSYQKASTNFDAYAQAVESLWAKGATDESKEYANRALALMKEDNWPEASYWAGRAIDISRTTAAHAFSYYLTSHYGIPHGHAVYMVFEYICRNNGHPEFIKTIPGLKTLRELADEKGVAWENMVEDLFNHVNQKRLGNNPVEVRRESFL